MEDEGQPEVGATAVGGSGPEVLSVSALDGARDDEAQAGEAHAGEAHAGEAYAGEAHAGESKADEGKPDEGEAGVAAAATADAGSTGTDANASRAPEVVAAGGPEKLRSEVAAPAHGQVGGVVIDLKGCSAVAPNPEDVAPGAIVDDVALRGSVDVRAPAASDDASVSPPDLAAPEEALVGRPVCDAGLAQSLDASLTESVRKKAEKETSDLSSSGSGTSSSDSEDDSDSDSSSSSDSSSDSSTGATELERVKRAVALAEAEANTGSSEPVRSKNEEDECKLEIPSVKFEVTDAHRLVPVGKIKSIMPKAIIVESLPGALGATEQASNPFAQKSDSVSDARALDAETVLVLSGPRVAFGRVHETFGPVLNPFYIVRFNSSEEIAALGAACAVGEGVAFIAGLSHLVRAGDIRSKGYDASNLHDEELPGDRQDHSDDEAEAMAKRAKKRPQGGTRGSGLQTGGGPNSGAQDRPYKRGAPGGRGENRGPSSQNFPSQLPAPPRRASNFRGMGHPGEHRAHLPPHLQAPVPGGARQPIYHNGVPAPSIHPLLAQQQQQQSQFHPYQTQAPQGHPAMRGAGQEQHVFRGQVPSNARNPTFRSQPATSLNQSRGQNPMQGHHPMHNFMPPPYGMQSPGLAGMTMPGISPHHHPQQPQHFPQPVQPSMYQPAMPVMLGGLAAGIQGGMPPGMPGGMPPGMPGGIPGGMQGGLPPGMQGPVPPGLPPGMHLGVPGMHASGMPIQQPALMSHSVPGEPQAPPWHAVRAHLANGPGGSSAPVDQSRASTDNRQAPHGDGTTGDK